MKSTEAIGAPVWDLPTRLFHWMLVPLLGLSWWSAEYAFESWHFWSGYALLFLLLFRILWGFFGSSTARFASFVRGPAVVLRYLRGDRWRFAGHRPLGGLSVVAMLLALLVQVCTGLIQVDSDDFTEGPLASLVSFEVAEGAHEVHELNFNILLALIGLHVAAILFYRVAHGRKLLGPMLTGRAVLGEGIQPMIPASRNRAAACAIVALLVSGWVVLGAPPLG